MFFSSILAIIVRERIRLTSQKAERNPIVSRLSANKSHGDIISIRGPNTDFSLAANMLWLSGFDNFLDSLMGRGFLSRGALGDSTISGIRDRPCVALCFFTSFNFILPPQFGQYR
jgi:hypothetical protein